ncbi:MAG: hypothetical protein AAGF97_19630, partial [Planctomycetota bacterium]
MHSRSARRLVICFSLFAPLLVAVPAAMAQAEAPQKPAADGDELTTPTPPPSPFLDLVSPQMKRLSPDAAVWIDPAAGCVYVHGFVT